MSDPTFDRMKRALAGLIRATLPTIDYLAHYPCTVVSQNGDGSLELVPDDQVRLPTLSRIPIRYGEPGITATVSAGARVMLTFDGGDPSKPRAVLWEAHNLTALVVTAASKISLNAPAVNLGGDPAVHPLVIGDTYRTAEDAFFAALIAAAATLSAAVTPPATATAVSIATAIGAFSTALGTALSTFQGTEAAYLSQVSKTA